VTVATPPGILFIGSEGAFAAFAPYGFKRFVEKAE
jgi:hypothetical protein